MEAPRLRVTFSALRRFSVAGLRRRALIGLPPALDRRFIASPRSGQGIVAGQINKLEVANRGLRAQLAGRLPMSGLGH